LTGAHEKFHGFRVGHLFTYLVQDPQKSSLVQAIDEICISSKSFETKVFIDLFFAFLVFPFILFYILISNVLQGMQKIRHGYPNLTIFGGTMGSKLLILFVNFCVFWPDPVNRSRATLKPSPFPPDNLEPEP
jgi:hypothetical protein